jgi:hypothetical protein
MGISDDHISS